MPRPAPRQILTPSEGVVWSDKLSSLVSRVNNNDERMSSGEWKMFKALLANEDPPASKRREQETARRRGMAFLRSLTIEEVQAVLDEKLAISRTRRTPTEEYNGRSE